VPRQPRVALDAEAQALGLRADAEHELQVLEHGVQVERDRPEGTVTGLDAGHLEDVLDDVHEVLPAAHDRRQVLPVLRRQPGVA
jgi:hypothetical protein